jgi:thiosulfate/3-mercaptopyruvate sulfurtransferase
VVALTRLKALPFRLMSVLIAVISLALLTGYRRSTALAPLPIDQESGDTTPRALDRPGDPWSAIQVIAPQDLAKRLLGPDKPLVLHVGVPVLFKNGHIPGSKYVGQASTPSGIVELKNEAQGLPRNKELVLYCGCCPWKDCPNIRPAFKALQQMRFTKVRVLYLVNNFGEDWIKKGYPVEK